VDLLKAQPDVDVFVNNQGWGRVMHAHTYGPYYFWKGRKYPGRRIITAHVIPDSARGSLPAWKLLLPLVRWYLRKVYAYADVCLAVSPTVEEAIRDLNVSTRVVQVVNPVSTEKYSFTPERRQQGRAWLGLPENAFVVLGVGQLQGRKGVEDFIDIAAACPGLTFVWAGGRPFGIMTEGIVKLNRRMAAAGPNVKFLGMFELEQMPLIYNAADLFLFPSYQENCPLAPLEAAAAGLPVIFRDLREYASLYAAPYLKAGNTQEFIALTQRMVAESDFYAQGKDMSRELLVQFEKHKIRERLIKIYRAVATQNFASLP
jgi:1,2-diacylglycerol-3-alpha-glucose alpha-1,2-galactosyltransferase